MAPKVKEALSWASEALETAAGWAILLVISYALLFVDFTGNGRLWDSIRGAAQELSASRAAPRASAVQVRVVPVRPVDEAKRAQDRMLTLPEVADQEIRVPVVVAEAPRPADQVTDAPADASASAAPKDWKRHLTTRLRSFTVYGRGEETSSASASAKNAPAAAPAKAAASVPTAAVASSAYRAGAATPVAARPGVSDHVSRVDDGAADGVRNFK